MPPYILQSKTDWSDFYRKIDRSRKAVRCHGLRQSPRCDQPQRRLSGGQRLSCQLVRRALGGACTTQCLRCQVRQVEHRRLAHPAAKVAVSGVSVHQKAVRYPAKADESPGRRQHREQLRRRIVRIGDLRKRKKRPHLVENQISKSLKELFK